MGYVQLSRDGRAVTALFAAAAIAPIAAAEVDFSRDVAPVLARCCLSCHRPDGPGAYDFTDPANVRRVARTLLATVESGAMPPFLPEAGVVTVPPRPDADEIAMLKAWVQEGVPIGGARTVLAGEPRPAAPSLAAWEVAGGWSVAANESRVMRSFVVGVVERPLEIGGWRVRAETPGLVARTLLAAGDAGLARALDERDASLGFKFTGDLGERRAGSLGGVGIGGTFSLPAGFAMRLAAGEAIVAECHADGRGKEERGGFRLEALPAVAAGDAAIRTVSAFAVGGGGEERTSSDGPTVSSTMPPIERDLDLVAITLRPGPYATATHLQAIAPDGRETTLVRIDRWNAHADRPYPVDPPYRLARGTRLSLGTTAENEILRERSTPQAVLLVAEAATDSVAPSSGPTSASGSPVAPGPATREFLAAAVECRTGDRTLLATPLVPATAFRELLGIECEPRTGPTDAAGLTWFEAVELANALSRRCGLPQAYRLEFPGRDGDRLVSAVVTPVPGEGWRLPDESEWRATFSCAAGLSGSLWNWTSDAEGTSRVVRGGCWADQPGTAGPDARGTVAPATRNELFGARLVRTSGR
jgi:hypothetical protein